MTLAALNAHLDAAISDVWRDCLQGVITEGEAAHRVTMLTAHRSAGRPDGRPLRAALPISRFTLRRCQRSPDREASRTRRRMLARDGRMPPGVRAHYTEGEASALRVIAGEVKHHGVCDFPIDKIAALAGVGRTTVQNAVREAGRLGYVQVERRPIKGRKNDTNLVRIVSREWLAWVCAVTRRRFPVGASPTRRTLQPEAAGAAMEVTK